MSFKNMTTKEILEHMQRDIERNPRAKLMTSYAPNMSSKESFLFKRRLMQWAESDNNDNTKVFLGHSKDAVIKKNAES